MKLLYKHQHEGVWFSRNGHAAYLRGEKPHFLWPPDAQLEPTVEHHIARLRRDAHRVPPQDAYTRELVMFFRRPT